MIKYLFFMFVIPLIGPISAQEFFTKLIDQGEILGLECINEGSYIIAGTKRGRDQDLFIGEIDQNATLLWVKQFGTEGIDDLQRDGFLKTKEGSFLVLMNSYNYIDNISERKIFNFDQNGKELWASDLIREDQFLMKSIIELDTFYLVIVERDNSVVIQYLGKDGRLNKQLSYESEVRQIVKASSEHDGLVCVVGNYGEVGAESIFVLALDQTGNQHWKKILNSSFSNTVEDVVHFQNEWFIAGSTFVGPGQNHDRPIFYKLDEKGEVVKVDSINTGSYQDATPTKMVVNSSQNIIFVGPITKESPPYQWSGNHFYIGAIDHDLKLIWKNVIEDQCTGCGATAFWPQSVKVFNDFIVSGGSYEDSTFIIRSRLYGTVPTNEKSSDNVKVDIWPNPAHGEFNVTIDRSINFGLYHLSIFQNGQEITSKQIVPNEMNTIDIAKLPSGIYYVTVMNPNRMLIDVHQLIIHNK